VESSDDHGSYQRHTSGCSWLKVEDPPTCKHPWVRTPLGFPRAMKLDASSLILRLSSWSPPSPSMTYIYGCRHGRHHLPV
jgi:hypothetical protein